MFGTKYPVHHVDVDHAGPATLDRAELLAQAGEVSGQDRGREDHEAGLLTSRLSAARELTRWPAGGLWRSTIPGATPG